MNIAVLCGGLSAERDVSISSGMMAANALRRRGHKAVLMDLFFGYPKPYKDPQEIFTVTPDSISAAAFDDVPDLTVLRSQRTGASRIGDNVFEICAVSDIVFIALHGDDGEDGRIQAAFDLLGIKYTGTGMLGSAVAMNKSVAKQLLSAAGIKTPRGIVLHRGEYEEIGFPCAVKPCSGGSSVGASIVMSRGQYISALELAFKYDEEVIVEEYISGRECNVGVIAGKALPVIEICASGIFFDYKNKYQSGMAHEICPADLPGEITEKLSRLAERVFDTLRFQVYGRMDFILGGGGDIWCLEGNTLPGITATSLLPQEAAAAGIDYDSLCEIIIAESLKKYEAKEKSN